MLCVVALVREAGAQGVNYRPKAEDFRIVDGILYNTERSHLWTDISPGKWLVVVEVATNGIVVRERWVDYVYGERPVTRLERIGGDSDGLPAARPIIGSREREGAEFFIRNFPGKVADGDKLQSRRALETGLVRFGGKVLRVFDCGLENTEQNRKSLKPPPAIPKPE